ncbi:hypothetical protein CG09_1636 [Riemerella anatipestifer]|nr:hypothetical protein CG09_1636 [Riemerella anatipestifer]
MTLDNSLDTIVFQKFIDSIKAKKEKEENNKISLMSSSLVKK